MADEGFKRKLNAIIYNYITSQSGIKTRRLFNINVRRRRLKYIGAEA